MEPIAQLVGSLARMLVGLSVGPFPEAGLDEALGLTVGFWRVWFGSDVLEAEAFAGSAEGEGVVARSVVGHHPFDLDAETCIVSDRGGQKGRGASLPFIGHHLGEGDA